MFVESTLEEWRMLAAVLAVLVAQVLLASDVAVMVGALLAAMRPHREAPPTETLSYPTNGKVTTFSSNFMWPRRELSRTP
jgi:hypothetical protein